MTDSTTPQTDPTEPNQNKSKYKRRGRGTLFVIGILLTGAIAGSFATKAISHNRGWHGGPMGHMGFMRGPINPDKAAKRVERMAKHLSVEIDATPEQTAKLVAVAKSLAQDVIPLRMELRATRRSAVDMITSENFDRTALEKMRTEQLARFDTISKRALGAIADASEVLTPSQRTQLRERIQSWREARHSWGRGWGHGRGKGHGKGSHRGRDDDRESQEPGDSE